LSNYKKGRGFEYSTINYLRRKNYWCVRAWGSKGVYDILAIPKSENKTIPFGLLETLVPLSIKKQLHELIRFFKGALLIQAKTNGYVKPTERETLRKTTFPNATSLISYSSNRHVKFKSIGGEVVII